MRQLVQTGWMHNRARMIVASFLVKDLLIDWRWGERFFMQHLIDGDPAANNGGWQWTAGVGTDAAPYFRIFNPTLQAAKFDPDGAYVRRWVPELARVPDKHIHAPWLMPLDVQRQAGCVIGQDYPAPIVEHGAARDGFWRPTRRDRILGKEASMIPNQWYAVLDSNEVPKGKTIGVTRMGEKLVFWRDAQGKVSCLRDVCPHRGVALSIGKVLGDHVQCPFHGFEFDTTGRCVLIPANGRNGPISREMKAFDYPTYEAHGFIFIWWGQPTGERSP